MRSPFPGMDPYLERRWGDVHTKLCAFIGESLQAQLPGALRARAEERVLLEDDGESFGNRRPDISIVETGVPGGRNPIVPFAHGAAGVIEPFLVTLPEEASVDRWIQVIDRTNGNRVVTVIEILSPGNKEAGRLNDSYIAKLEAFTRADINIVEIDLLRGPRRHLLLNGDRIPASRVADYLYCFRRTGTEGLWSGYPMKLRDRLPVVPVPLRPTDADVTLDLQALIDRIYVAGGHDDIDYTQPLDPPLPPDDAAWLASLLPSTRPA